MLDSVIVIESLSTDLFSSKLTTQQPPENTILTQFQQSKTLKMFYNFFSLQKKCEASTSMNWMTLFALCSGFGWKWRSLVINASMKCVRTNRMKCKKTSKNKISNEIMATLNVPNYEAFQCHRHNFICTYKYI